MALSVTSILLLCILFFVIASVYSSVGFGGGSSYLAILALVAVSFYTMRSLALVCNIIVVSGSTYWFIKKGHFKISPFLPFIITSGSVKFEKPFPEKFKTINRRLSIYCRCQSSPGEWPGFIVAL